MVEIDTVAKELSSIERIIDALLNIDAKIGNALWRRKARLILKRLRDLYFREDGTLGFLRSVASGDSVSRDVLAEMSGSFYSSEQPVTDALADLNDKCRFNEVRLTIADANLISGIAHDKTRVRELIREIFRSLESGQIGNEERERAKLICESIEALNAKFCNADAALRKEI